MATTRYNGNVLYIDNFKGFVYTQTDIPDHECTFIFNDEYFDDPDNYDGCYFAEMIDFYIKEKGLCTKLKRGDLVIVNNDTQYRNDYTLIFNGTDLEPLDFLVDEYGSIPPDYKCFKDFHPRHWDISHNSFRTFDMHDLKRVINKKIKCKVNGVPETLHFLEFEYNSIEYLLFSRIPFTGTHIIQGYDYELGNGGDDYGYVSHVPEWLKQNNTRSVKNVWFEYSFEY